MPNNRDQGAAAPPLDARQWDVEVVRPGFRNIPIRAVDALPMPEPQLPAGNGLRAAGNRWARWWEDNDAVARAGFAEAEEGIAAALVHETATAKAGKRGEELFQLILSGIREIYDVQAVIAGGAVRDLAAGCDTPKDVDVFLPMTWDKFAEGIEELGWSGGVVKQKTKAYEGKGTGTFKSTARASSMVQDIPVDLVFLDKPLSPEMVKSFPVHAQRGIYTLEGGLDLSPEAKADIEAKQFTISPDITEKARIEALRKKVGEWVKRPHYKGWKIIEPDIKEWWEAKEELKAEETKKPEDLFEKYWKDFDQRVRMAIE
jgi:hypothetical protein